MIETLISPKQDNLLELAKKYPNCGFIQLLVFYATGKRPERDTVLGLMGRDNMAISPQALFFGYTHDIGDGIQEQVAEEDRAFIDKLIEEIIEFRENYFRKLEAFSLARVQDGTLYQIIKGSDYHFALNVQVARAQLSPHDADQRAYRDTEARFGQTALRQPPLNPHARVFYGRRLNTCESEENTRNGRPHVTTKMVSEELRAQLLLVQKIVFAKIKELHDQLLAYGHPGINKYLEKFTWSTLFSIVRDIGIGAHLNNPDVRNLYIELIILNSLLSRVEKAYILFSSELNKLPQYQNQQPSEVYGYQEMVELFLKYITDAIPTGTQSRNQNMPLFYVEALRWLILLSQDGVMGKAEVGGYTYNGFIPHDQASMVYLQKPQVPISSAMPASYNMAGKKDINMELLDHKIYPPFKITCTRNEEGMLEPFVRLSAWSGASTGSEPWFQEYTFPKVSTETRQIVIETMKPVSAQFDENSGHYFVDLYTPPFAKMQDFEITMLPQVEGLDVVLSFENGYRIYYAPDCGCYRLVLLPHIGLSNSSDMMLKYKIVVDADYSNNNLPDQLPAAIVPTSSVHLRGVAQELHNIGYTQLWEQLKHIIERLENGYDVPVEDLIKAISGGCIFVYSDQLPPYSGTKTNGRFHFLPPAIDGGYVPVQGNHIALLALEILKDVFPSGRISFAALANYYLTKKKLEYSASQTLPVITSSGSGVVYVLDPHIAEKPQFDIIHRTSAEIKMLPNDFWERIIQLFMDRAKEINGGNSLSRNFQFPPAVMETVQFIKDLQHKTANNAQHLLMKCLELEALWSIPQGIPLKLLENWEYDAYKDLFGGFGSVSMSVLLELGLVRKHILIDSSDDCYTERYQQLNELRQKMKHRAQRYHNPKV